MPCIKLSSGKTVCYGDNTNEQYLSGGTIFFNHVPKHFKEGGETENNNDMNTNDLKAKLAAMQDEINRTAEQYGLGGHLQHMLNGGQIIELPVAPYGFAEDGMVNNQYYSGGNIPTHPDMMHLYGFEDGGQTMEIPVAPYGYNEDGGENNQMPVEVAVARFKAAGKEKGLSGGELQMYVEKMKSKYNYQKGGAVKETIVGNYDINKFGSGGIMYNGIKFPGYNKAISTEPGDKYKKQMLLEKGGKIKFIKFGHR